MAKRDANFLANMDTLTLQADPTVFNTVMADFVRQLQAAFPHRKDQLAQAQQRMSYLTAVNTGAVMKYYKTAMEPHAEALCQGDTGFLINQLPKLQWLQGKISQQDVMEAGPQDRLMCLRCLKDLYLLSCGPQEMPTHINGLMQEMDKVASAITSSPDAVAALESAFPSLTEGKEPDAAALVELQKIMGQHGLPGLPGI